MNFGLSGKLAAAFAALAMASIFVMGGAGVLSTRSQVKDNVDQFLKERAEELTNGVRSAQPTRGDRNNGRNDGRNDDEAESADAEIEEALARSAVDSDAEVQSLDEDGTILATVNLTLPVDEQDLEIAEKQGEILRTVTIDGESYRMITSHVEGGGAVQVARNIENTNALIGTIGSRTLLIGLGLSTAAAAAGWLIAQRATRPIRSLTESVEHVAETRDLSQPVSVQRNDEIGRLALGFNEMLAALDESRTQQTQLVQDAAHELRTPLTSIQANVDMLAHAPNLEATERNDVIGGIRSQLRQLNSVVTEIVQLATDNHDPASHVRLNLADVARETAANFSMRASNPIEINADASIVNGDPVALDRVIGNLLANAEKYGPSGGPIKLSVQAGRVAVRDQGPGISPADQERIFDRFYRTSDAQPKPGSGLGLAIVKKIITEHQGQVFVSSSPQDGTEIGFVMPVIA